MSVNEKEYDLKINNNKHIIVRLDGHKFSKFTKPFVKPFDEVIGKTMEMVTTDLVSEFTAYTGYTQSDEITLFIPSMLSDSKDSKDWKHSYNGRIQKMNSLITSFTTVIFNKHLKKIHMEYKNEPYTGEDALFDCRVYGVNSGNEVFGEFLTRMRSAEKNSRSIFAQSFFTHKTLHLLNGKEMVELCLAKHGEDWNDVHIRYKYGVILKRMVSEETVNNKWFNGVVTRYPVKPVYMKMNYTDENKRIIFSKYLS